MKLLTYDSGSGPRCGVLIDDQMVDLTALPGADQTLPDVRALLELGDSPIDRVVDALARTIAPPPSILSSMSPLGLEPRTHGLKGRCSTN